MEENYIKPCPFCGGRSIVTFEIINKKTYCFIKCQSCGVQSEKLKCDNNNKDMKNAIINSWNSRYR